MTVTGSDRGKEDNEYWFQRYLLGRELINYRAYDRPEKGDTGKREILVIYEPFNLERAEKNILKKIEEEGRTEGKEEDKIFEEKEDAKKSLKESKDCNDNFENLISRIKTEKGANIHIKPYRFPFDFNELRRDTMGEEVKYDLILYIGSHIKEEKNEYGALAIERRGEILPFNLEYINSNKHNHPLIFLDACKTGIESEQSLSGKKIGNIAQKFLHEGSSAFIGTFSDIEVIPATDFAYYFLNSICYDGTSLAEAMFYARNEVFKKYKNKDDKISETRCVLRCVYTLVGNCSDNLYYSFLHGKKKIKPFWSSVANPYFEPFLSKEIYPSGVSLITENSECHDFRELEKKFNEVKKNKDYILMVDMPILYAIEEISKNGDEWVIINGTFRVQSGKENEDATLYYFKDIRKVDRILLEDRRSTVSVMAHVYLMNKEKDIFHRCVQSPWPMDYEEIIDLIKGHEINNYLEKLGNCLFLLPGDYKDKFEDFKRSSQRLRDANLQDVNLYDYFKNIFENFVNGSKNNQEYKLKRGFPASVLIARREDVKNYYELFEELLTRWYIWRERCFFKKHKKLSDRQEQIYELKDEDKNTLIRFSQFVKNKLGGEIFGKKIDIKRQLRLEDFVDIKPRGSEIESNEKTESHPVPSQWSAGELRIRKHELRTKLDIKYSEVSTDIDNIFDKRSKKLKEVIGMGAKNDAEEQLKNLTLWVEREKEDIDSKKTRIEEKIKNVGDEKGHDTILKELDALHKRIEIEKIERGRIPINGME